MNNGQQVDILLPFSNGEYYSEYLVNKKYLTKLFKKHKFDIISDTDVNEYFNYIKTVWGFIFDGMSDIDKEYMSLYTELVFEKK